MGRVAVILLPVGVAVVTLALAAALLPACAVGVWPWSNACPPVADTAAADRRDALAARRAALEAEIAAVQRRVAALPACPQPVAEAPPEPEPPPEPETPPVPPDRIDPERWRNRDVSLLEGCWTLDSDLRMRDVNTGAISRVRSWRVCFDAEGRGSQTLVFTNGARCQSPVTGRFAGDGTLRIDDGRNVECSDRSFIYRRQSTCRLNAAGRADCSAFQRETNSRSPFTLRR